MQPIAILYPAFVMALLTFVVAVWLLHCRIKAVKAGLTPLYFKLNHGAKLPDYLVQATQHYDNQFEMPVLFYVVLLLAYVTQGVDLPMIGLAWAFVVTRVVHTVIHLSSNRLRWRRDVFLVGFAILVTLWGLLLAHLLINS